MKKLHTILTTLVLLIAAMMANAQTSGKVSADGAGITYSFSGGTLKDQGSNDGGRSRGYTFEVRPGDVITFQCKAKGTKPNGNPYKIAEAKLEAGVTHDAIFRGNRLHLEKEKDVSSAGFSYTVPKEAGIVEVKAKLYPVNANVGLLVRASFQVVKDKPTTKTETKPEYVSIDDPDCECMKRLNNQKTDSHIRFNDFYGEVKIRPNCAEDDSYEFVDLDTEIYECDRIKTEEESSAILGLWDMSTYVIKPESILVIYTEDDNTSRIELIAGAFWGNWKKMMQGKSIKCEMSQGVSGISGTIVGYEETGTESKMWLFAGKANFTNKKTKKVTVLEPGQNITCKGGTSDVKPFNIEQGAKKFGIKMSDINNHYSNANSPMVEDGVYVIRFTHNPEYVLTLKDGKAVNNGVVHLWKWQNTNAQKWKVTHKDGKIAIRSMVDPNFALDVKSFNYSNNADIILYKYLGNDNQLWIPERLDNGSYLLKTAGNSSFCIDLYKGNATNGGKIELYNAHKLWPEWWTLEKVK